MTDYIRREAAIKLFNFAVLDCLGMEPTIRAGDIIKALESVPAADVREVVLCKDCKWYQIDELKKDGTEDRRYKPSVCVLAEQRREPNHFCADGEKREEQA